MKLNFYYIIDLRYNIDIISITIDTSVYLETIIIAYRKYKYKIGNKLMKSVSGIININSLFNNIKNYVTTTIDYYDRNNYVSFLRVTDKFLESLLLSPVIIYVTKGTIPANVETDDIIKYLDNIIYVEDDITLLYLYLNLSREQANSFKIQCVIIETNRQIIKTRPLKNVILLDHYLLRNKKGAVVASGKLDYSKLENQFREIFNVKNSVAWKKLLKKPGKYFYQSLLGLNLYKKAIDEDKVKHQKDFNFLYANANEVNLNDFDPKCTYDFRCPICNNIQSVYIDGTEKKTNLAYDLILYNHAAKAYEFKCSHLDTIYEDNNKYFRLDKKYYEYADDSFTKKDASKVFLFIFCSFLNEDESSIQSDNNKEDLETAQYKNKAKHKIVCKTKELDFSISVDNFLKKKYEE